MRSRYVPCFLILGSFLAAQLGCGGKKIATAVPGAQGRAAQKFSMQINVADGANENFPIAMDLVTITDKKIIAEVGKLSARDWFDRRVQILRDSQGKVSVASWEWVPGQHAGPISVDIAKKTRVAYVFANYLNGATHRALVDVRTPIVVNLGAEDFTLQPLK